MDDQSEAIAFLASGAGLDPHRPIRIDTHASIVFLIGEAAYKLKRAVRYPYLDYSTLERREDACRAEYEINSRITPQLYISLHAIRRRDDGTIAFDCYGETLDWVVEMRRFDGEKLFDRLAETGGLTAPLMRELADIIAAFHKNAAVSTEKGGSAGIARVIDENTDALRHFDAIFAPDAVGRLDQQQHAALALVSSRLDRRRRHGRVRACHGDLHLGNICLFDGKPALFDAIEFEPDFSTIDVLYELAFLVMDLLHRRLGNFANLVMNRYLDRTGDDDGLPALPLFLSARAAIRAHVSAAAVATQEDADARARKEEAARSNFALALALMEPGQKRLVAVGGRSGSGKSTLARAIASEFTPAPGARVLSSDVIRKTMLDLAPESPLPASAYSHAMSRQVYATMQRAAASVLNDGYSVILDATFLDATERAAAAQVASNAGVPFTGIWVEARAEVMSARIAGRFGDASDATVAVLEQQLRGDPGAIDWRRIDSSGSLGRVANMLKRAVFGVSR
ncbi:MAG TPA: AAA family ATPase [Stellaceae bacterium]|nr:AAA family ATPase [Stellaceae bacterium]